MPKRICTFRAALKQAPAKWISADSEGEAEIKLIISAEEMAEVLKLVPYGEQELKVTVEVGW